jgi:hypothetical protein
MFAFAAADYRLSIVTFGLKGLMIPTASRPKRLQALLKEYQQVQGSFAKWND